MCGVVGIASSRPVDPERVAAAVLAIQHRGPDGHGTYVDVDHRVGLGHARLSIIDLSDAGAQPMCSADGRHVISFNGEIYNYRELRSELAAGGVRFRGHSDTEVLLEGYARFGAAYLNRLNGIFAFAILDTASGDVVLARDQLGVKPLYYAETVAGVAFASELKALLQLTPLNGQIDARALRAHLTFLWAPGDSTMLQQVRRLEPGTLLRIAEGRVRSKEVYWRLPNYAPRRAGGPKRAAAELRDLIDICVERQLVADVPVGAFLSGGLDSSAVVAAARSRARDLRCFTINSGDADDGVTDDLPFARSAAAQLGVELHEVTVDPQRFCDRLLDLPWMLDEPIADPATLNVFFIAELAKSQGVTVLLSGAGGDDLFSGYRRHAALAAEGVLANLPSALRTALAGATARLPASNAHLRRLNKFMATVGLDQGRRIATHFAWSPPDISDALLAPELRDRVGAEDALEPLERLISEHSGLPPLEQCLRLEQRFFLADHNLIYTDKMSMAAGVESRVPLLDLELVEFAAQIPAEWKQRGVTPKWLLKQSQTGRLPHNIIHRPKTGFGAPLRRWMQHEMRDVMDSLLSPAVVSSRGLFDPAAVASLRSAHELQRQDGSYTLFSLMCVELWCRRFLDSPPAIGRQPGRDSVSMQTSVQTKAAGVR